MSESILKKFGKYFLLDRVGEGGMAEIFRARLASIDQSGRFIVIKRIQSAYSNNAEFVQMFRSEVQVTMRFAHPNIVQLYEAGEEQGQQFIAMELVDGRNLRQVLSKCNQKQTKIPVSAACFIIEQTAAGLHYAHTFKDRITGEPLNLVHRDVSPQNILVSYDGNIKVIDFGIAKAATNGEATRAGVIKGKLSYLSPEQVAGEVLDARSDVFALGIVLWELLTGKRLFVSEGDNEFQVLKMIESCNSVVKMPSSINPDVPRELDMIVMQALARDRKKRFQSGEDMARALRKLLAVEFSDFGPSDLSVFVKKLFHELIVDDRKQLQHLNTRAEELIQLGGSEKDEAEDTAVSLKSAPDEKAKAKEKEKEREHTRMSANVSMGDKFDRSQITDAVRIEVAGQPQRQMKVPVARPQPGAPQQTTHQPVQRHQNTASMVIPKPIPVTDRQSSSGGGFLKVALSLGVVGFAGYYGYTNYYLKMSAPHAATTPTTTAPTRVASGQGKQMPVRVRLFPDGNISKTRVTINSQIFDLEKGILDVPVGEPLEIIVDRPGFITYRKEFTLREDEVASSKEWSLDVKLEPMVYGTLSISTRPSVADVRIVNLDQGTRGLAQEPVILKTPVYQEKLPAGHYNITVRNDLLSVEKTFQVEVQEGKEAVFSDLQLDTQK